MEALDTENPYNKGHSILGFIWGDPFFESSHSTVVPGGCFCEFGILFVDVPEIRALLLRVYVRASDFLQAPQA